MQRLLATQREGGTTLEVPADQKRPMKEVLGSPREFQRQSPEDETSRTSAFDTLLDPSGQYRSLDDFGSLEEYEFEIREIPCDMWGVAIMTLTRDLGDIVSGNHCGKHLVRFLYAFFCAIMNLTLQLVILWYVKKFVVGDSVWHIQGNYAQFHVTAFTKDKVFDPSAWRDLDPVLRDELCSAVITNPMFLGIILFLWVGRMMGEFKACNRLWTDLTNLATIPSAAYSHQCMVERDGNHQIIGVKCETRFLIYILVLIPKVFIALVLMMIGLQWLTATEGFADLVLNALALGFIADIDENILNFFLPKRCGRALEETKFAYPSKGKKSEDVKLGEMVHDYVRNICFFVVAVTIVYLFIGHLQQVLPYFPHDIREHCGLWYENRFIPKCTPFMKGCFPYGSGATPPHHISYDEMVPNS